MSVVAARLPAKAACISPDIVSGIIGRIESDGILAPVSQVRIVDLIRAFSFFLLKAGLTDLTQIEPDHAEAFIRSLTRSGANPSLATMHLRRSAVRIFFKEAKYLGFVKADPSADVVLPKRAYRDSRPLADKEIDRCRSFASGMVGEPAFALAWALAEAGARVPELGHVRVGDCDPGGGLVRLPGCSSTVSRLARLTTWGHEQLATYLGATSELGSDQSLLGSDSRGSMHELIASTLRRAGILKKPGVRPNSVPAWRGAYELDNGATIDEVAQLLGMRSLDRTASFIGFEWKGGA